MNYLLPPFHRRTWSARWVGHNTQHLRGVNCIINAFHPPKFSPFSSQSFQLVGGWTNPFETYYRVKNGCIFPKFRGEHWKYMWNQHLGPRKVNRTNWSMKHVQVIVAFHVLILTILTLLAPLNFIEISLTLSLQNHLIVLYQIHSNFLKDIQLNQVGPWPQVGGFTGKLHLSSGAKRIKNP